MGIAAAQEITDAGTRGQNRTVQPVSHARDGLDVLVAFDMNRLSRFGTNTLAEYVSFINDLPLTDDLVPGHVQGGFPNMQEADALQFVRHWLDVRPMSLEPPLASLSSIIGQLRVHTASLDDVGVINASSAFWIAGELLPTARLHAESTTADWDTAYHASHIGVVYAVLVKGRLETGPRAKTSNRGQLQYGVYCHKRGTRRKCASYLTYFQFSGFVAAPLFELKVRHSA